MLIRLSIKNVVLIESLDLDFADGLCVFTGETGAGKSILLDSLALATGARSDVSLIRHGSDKLTVAAEFSVDSDHNVFDLLAEQDISFETGEPVVLRRSVSADGKSRAFVNDQPVNVAFLRQVGDRLVEIHGQFATHGLLNPVTHRGVLDAYGRLETAKGEARAAYRVWKDKGAEKRALAETLERARAEEDFLRHSVDELTAFATFAGEEKELADRRALMMNGEKIAESMNAARQALNADGLDHSLRQAERQLETLSRLTDGRFDPILDLLAQANANLSEAGTELENEWNKMDFNPQEQEAIEERLFALRSLARKHQVSPDDLPALAQDFEKRLTSIDRGGDDLSRLEREEEAARLDFVKKAAVLSAGRRRAAERLDGAVAKELPPLKLDRATFKTDISPLDEEQWNEDGADRVVFTASTNAGTPLAPINKIASGGELARFMLALKVNLAEAENIPTLIFDEVDSAVGGATANAIGERLARLATERCQVLAITHSPQVAAFAKHHFRVEKHPVADDRVETNVVVLDGDHRREEIARMLSGAVVTDASRAAAVELLRKKEAV